MTPAPRERAAVDRAPADPAREPGLAVPPVADRPGTLDGAAGDTTRIPAVRRAPSSQPLPEPREAAAGTPAPVTGAVRLDRDAAPARGRSKTPAGGAPASRERASTATSVPPAGQTAMAVMAAAMSEDRGRDSLDAHVRRLCDDLGLLRYHTHDSRRSPRGYPDLTICGPGGILFRELKTQRGKVRPEQQQWLEALRAAGQDAKVWRPIDLLNGTVAAELAALAGRRTAGGAA